MLCCQKKEWKHHLFPLFTGSYRVNDGGRIRVFPYFEVFTARSGQLAVVTNKTKPKNGNHQIPKDCRSAQIHVQKLKTAKLRWRKMQDIVKIAHCFQPFCHSTREASENLKLPSYMIHKTVFAVRHWNEKNIKQRPLMSRLSKK